MEDSDAEKFTASQPPILLYGDPVVIGASSLSVDQLAPEINELSDSGDISGVAMPPRPDKMSCAEHLAAKPPESDGQNNTAAVAAVVMFCSKEIPVVSEMTAASGPPIS
jgi:hypothetical protein